MNEREGDGGMAETPGEVRGIALAGVHHWGRAAFERLLPRALLPLAGSPLICFAMRWLRDRGIARNAICANSDSRLVRHCLGDGTDLGLDLSYFEDETPRGPAGCVRDAGLLWPADHYVVVEGGVVPSVDLGDVLAEHRRSRAAVTVVVESAPTLEAPLESPLRPMGVYVFARRALEAVPATGYQDIKEVLIPALYGRKERVLPYHAPSGCPRVTGLESYLAAHEWAVARIIADVIPLAGYVAVGEADVHVSAAVAPSARLVGPVLIGPGARVADEATIVGPTVIGPSSVVESRAVVCRSAVWDRCRIGARALVDHCVLAFEAEIASEERSQNALHLPGDGTGRLASEFAGPPRDGVAGQWMWSARRAGSDAAAGQDGERV